MFRLTCLIYSFPADTLVHSEEGKKPISEVKVGDKVLSYDERTEKTLYQPVMAVIQGERQYQMVKLTLASGDSIEATAEHPFYIKGKGWNPASSLKVGQALQLHNGTTVVINEIDTSSRVEKVYNLTVANTHNYFVGVDGVLVHNCPPTLHDGAQGKHIPGHNNYTPGRSPLTHPNPQKLWDDHAGKGQPVNNIPVGQPGSKERVDFGEKIGDYVDQNTKQSIPTTKGLIHYGKKGAHIVPAKP